MSKKNRKLDLTYSEEDLTNYDVKVSLNISRFTDKQIKEILSDISVSKSDFLRYCIEKVINQYYKESGNISKLQPIIKIK